MTETIRARAQALLPELTAIRRDFHRFAEPGWMEMRTTSLLARRLTDLGYEVLTGPAVCKADARMGLPSADALEAHYKWAQENGADPEFLPVTRGGFTGGIATLHCGEGPTVALRFDIDALGVLEASDETHLPHREGFASVTPGVMHACGHDGHAAVGIGTAMLLRELRRQLHGTVRLIFQPAEEGVRGASSVVAAGHLDGADYALAAHVFPAGKAAGLVDIGVLKENGQGGLATSKLDVTFRGRSAHAGIAPQEGRNALLAAATAVLNLHAIPRFGSTPTQLNVGTLHAGTGRNVICETAKLELEVRGQTTEANEYMLRRAQQIVKSAAEMQDCTVETQAMGHAAALTCDWTLSERVERVCKETLGLRVMRVGSLGGGSEDFSCMAQRVQQQSGQAAYVGLLCACPAANHNDHFDFDEQALANGAAMFTAVTASLLA